VLFGSWTTTDDYAIHLVQLPLSVVQAIVFTLFGVGLVQARLISVAATVAMGVVLLLGLRRPLGLAGAMVAAVGASFSALTLYYARLALLEPGVALALSVAAVAAVAVERGSVRRWAVVCGIALATAMGLKVSALPSAVGILLAIGLRGIREPTLRPFPVIAAGIVGVAGAAWLILVAQPAPAAPGGALALLPTGTFPRSVADWVADVLLYLRSNDGAARLARPLLVGASAGLVIVLTDLVWRARRHDTSASETRAPAGEPSTPRDEPWTMAGSTRVAIVGLMWVAFGLLGVVSNSYQPNRYVVPILPGLALIAGAGVAILAARTLDRPQVLRISGLALVLALLAAPGLAAAAGWAASTGRETLDGQAAVERMVPPGVTLAGGYAPLFGMRAPVVTSLLISQMQADAPDLYAEGVRWAVEPTDHIPAWAAAHPGAWTARRELWCTDWGKPVARVCLVELP
jgi:4-amino-4-deoxy-L-arabinose transferase-like glycosyltransferase